jgi:glycosyltransferase involved in cell wall biosynthesis
MTDVAVTAIVSTYRAERFMRGRLENLVAQTLGERLEILVIDSGSPEDEGAIVREFQRRHANVRYVRTSMREDTSAAFNRAIGIARGRYLTTANADDRHRADALELMARALDEHPEFGIVYADSLITNGANETFARNTAVRRHAWPDYTPAAALSCCLFGAMPLWRKAAHAEVGRFAA